MRTTFNKLAALAIMFGFSAPMFAQINPEIQYFRKRDQSGINIFEVTKTNTEEVEYKGLAVRVGGNFTQQFQSLSHETGAQTIFNQAGDVVVNNNLYALAPGFNLATANLNFDVQLGDGIRVALENYMSSRHHPEFWVKGGYIRIDKLKFTGLENTDWFDNNFAVRLGHMQVNYGDQQFRRSDNGNTAWNPFVGNYIMDAFATEIGGELYYFNPQGFFGMFGMTAGFINGDILDRNPNDLDNLYWKRSPTIYLKGGYDKQLNEDNRVRLSVSYMTNPNHPRNTLYSGDRTGSRFYGVMENTAFNAANNFTSGRMNPGFTNNISALMLNVFYKFQGLEFFGTFENASGKSFANNVNPENVDQRSVTQLAAEVIYRFFEKEQVFVGARFNTVSGQFLAAVPTEEQTINRLELSAGWWMTQNLMLKLGYVNQSYDGFNATRESFSNGNSIGQVNSDIRNAGLFSGIVVEAIVAF